MAGRRVIAFKKGSVRDLFWNFARAEFEIPESGPRHTQPRISSELRERVLRDEGTALSDADWEELRAAVLSTRADILEALLDERLKWYRAELPASEWPTVRVMDLQIFTRIAPSRHLLELATALDAGAVPSVWSPSNYPRLRAAFDRSRMHGDPVLVAQRRAGPYTLIEGTTRMCVLVSRHVDGEVEPRSIPVVLGVGPHVDRWEFY
jgi:hypothetical protein